MSNLTKNQRRKKKLKARSSNENDKFDNDRRSAHWRMFTLYGKEYYRKRFGTTVLK